jgi:hypothetical protein
LPGIAPSVRDAVRALLDAEVTTTLDPDGLGYMLLSVVRGIDSLAKGTITSPILQDVARSATALLRR